MGLFIFVVFGNCKENQLDQIREFLHLKNVNNFFAIFNFMYHFSFKKCIIFYIYAENDKP